MATTLNDLNNTINDRRRDTGSNSVDMTTVGLREINGTLQLWQQFHDWPFTIEKQEINYNPGIDTYDLNADFKAPIDLRYKKPPIKTEFAMVSMGNFDSETLKTNRFAIQERNQVEQIRVVATRGNSISIHTMSTYDGNGTWVASGAASGIGTDSYEYFEESSSIKFDFSGTAGILTLSSGMSAVDVRDFVNRGNMYINWYLDSITNFTSIALKIGSDASNYYSETVTTDYLGDALTDTGWNKFKFNPWSSETGTVDDQNIDYLEWVLTYSSDPAITVRVEHFFASENIPLIFEYYSTNMITDSASVARAIFPDSTTTATPLWSGKWDFINESFINSVLETIFWVTGEYDDKYEAEKRVAQIVGNLRTRIPSRRRYPELQFIAE